MLRLKLCWFIFSHSLFEEKLRSIETVVVIKTSSNGNDKEKMRRMRLLFRSGCEKVHTQLTFPKAGALLSFSSNSSFMCVSSSIVCPCVGWGLSKHTVHLSYQSSRSNRPHNGHGFFMPCLLCVCFVALASGRWAIRDYTC